MYQNGPNVRQYVAQVFNTVKLCDPEQKPLIKRKCSSKPCYEWRSDTWSECSSTCGQGFMTRRVYCFDILANSTSDFCEKEIMPKTVKRCELQECPIQSENDNCVNKLAKNICRMIAYSNRCSEPYLHSKCCKTCSNLT
ncbi:A disintegrin and metallo ase with thrombospondin motifs 7 isoform X2 [Brachionus plicatilis]|uniref:A disintegrin and metallo ase with thrombospondin motifs 7 isoform X2 n=1 Tax=Brachionus plicatilis TaxID=10195 RepID=A0A3M7SE25_BRAPC|nr:A disintegrin and metallo ase with thrombospondin motifs 7 isoform X2 [Brachionus plicatilis]